MHTNTCHNATVVFQQLFNSPKFRKNFYYETFRINITMQYHEYDEGDGTVRTEI